MIKLTFLEDEESALVLRLPSCEWSRPCLDEESLFPELFPVFGGNAVVLSSFSAPFAVELGSLCSADNCAFSTLLGESDLDLCSLFFGLGRLRTADFSTAEGSSDVEELSSRDDFLVECCLGDFREGGWECWALAGIGGFDCATPSLLDFLTSRAVCTSVTFLWCFFCPGGRALEGPLAAATAGSLDKGAECVGLRRDGWAALSAEGEDSALGKPCEESWLWRSFLDSVLSG